MPQCGRHAGFGLSVHRGYSRVKCGALGGFPFPQGLLRGVSASRATPAQPAPVNTPGRTEKRRNEDLPKQHRRRRTDGTSPKKKRLSVLPCRGGGQVEVQLEETASEIRVTIRHLDQENSIRDKTPTVLLWGVYRGSARRWHHPQGVAPPGSVLDEISGAMRSPFPPQSDTISLLFHRRLAPASLAFALSVGHRPLLPLVAPHFVVPLGMTAGTPVPLGPSHAPKGINFSVASQSAKSMSLVVVARTAQEKEELAGEGAVVPGESTELASDQKWQVVLELELDPTVHRTGSIWHVCLPALRPSNNLAYAWRVDGDEAWDSGNRTQPGW